MSSRNHRDENDDDSPQRKRRRIMDDHDDDDENNADDASVEGSTGSIVEGSGDLVDSPPRISSQQRQRRQQRQELLARQSAERRRRRRQAELRAEVAELQAETFTAVGDDDNDDNHRGGGPSDIDDDLDQDHDIEDGAAAAAAAALLEEEEDGEDLVENAERDYQPIAALDHYGREGIDDRDYELMDADQRQAAEAELAVRDRQLGRTSGRSAGLYDRALDDLATEEDEEARRARRGIFRVDDDDDADEGGEGPGRDDEETDEEDLDGEDPINMEAFDVPLREWIAQDRTRREIRRKFRAFIRHFTEESMGEDHTERRRRGNGMYEQKIRTMCASNLSTLQVSYSHLMEAEPVLAFWLVDAPKDMFDVLNEAATRHTLMLFPSYNTIRPEIHVRISNYPIMDSLRDLRRSHLDCLVKVHGVITRRGAVSPQLQMAYYRCLSCRTAQGPFRVEGTSQNAADAYIPEECPNCDSASRFKLDSGMSTYRNFQRVNLQETPGSVPPGRVPRTKEVLLVNDLIDIARPGEEIEVTGIYEHSYDAGMTLKSGFPVFSTFLVANHVRKREDASSASNLSEADIRQILALSKDPRIGDRIVQSIAPSIFGHETCKMALAMSLFGGVPKDINDKHRIRGDVNVLLLGDPGTAKSQLLKYAENTAPRAVYSTGKGASAVGLTASVHKDPITKEWTLEGGALVLADKGVALIDEFDKSKHFFPFLFLVVCMERNSLWLVLARFFSQVKLCAYFDYMKLSFCNVCYYL